MSSLKRCVEVEVLKSHFAQLHEAVVNPDVFGTHLMQCGFATFTDISGIVSTLGYSNHQKMSQLLEIACSRIRTATSKESARNLFNQLVLIFANCLDRVDIADALITTYSKSEWDPTHVHYYSPSLSSYTPFACNDCHLLFVDVKVSID